MQLQCKEGNTEKERTARCWIHSLMLKRNVPPRSTVSWSRSMCTWRSSVLSNNRNYTTHNYTWCAQ